MKPVFTFVLVFLQLYLYGQGRVTGRVAGPAAPFATIALLKATDSSLVRGGQCDSLGRFDLPAAYGHYMLAAGKTYSTPFILDSVRTSVELLLEPAATALKEVSVTASKPYIEQQIDKLVLNVENSVMAAGNTIFDLLLHAPGMKQDQDENLVMMGKPGVQIWIDGRPSPLSGEALRTWLKNQPADVVAKIELIAHPSARYDAAGGAGIINIRLKKNVQQGANGNVYTSLAAGRYPKGSAGLNMNYRKNQLNFFGNYSYSYSESFNYRTQSTTSAGKPVMSYDNYWHPIGHYHYLNAGADYKPDSRTTIGLLVNGNLSATDATTDANTVVYDLQSTLRARSAATDRWHRLGYNLNFLRELDTLGSTFNMDADYSRYDKTAREGITNDDGYHIFILRNAAPVNVAAASFKADYVKYFTKTLRIEGGIKVNHVRTDNDIRYDSLLQQKWVLDKARSNQFVYTEQIQAVYIAVAREWKQLTVQAGLRAERTDATGHSVTLGQQVQRRYIDLFPSVNILKKINENNTLSFSYARRIDRPSYQSLNPFAVAIDPYNIRTGNPYLRAAYNNTFELRHGFRQFLWTTLYYRRGSNDVNSIYLQDDVTKIQTVTYQNIGSSDYGYISVSAGGPITSWWQMDLSGGFGYAAYRSATFETGNWGAETSLDNTFTFCKDLRLMISMFYNTAAPGAQRLQRANYGGSISANKPVFNKRGRVSLSVQDPFNLQRYDADIYTNASTIRWINRWESRKVSVSFSWKFGSQQIKAARERKSGLGDVEKRVNM
ncbi:outer membrane beta-barrel family protein [Chitinophaga horti]|uniref:Outer membrane beta-barrel family protein n=1 Tax=Chitinophaga horti TaxID=2920382 RepID=A0ABY6J1K8_9BACT|nr:outer membrane beta-barrel family protein [Chitinophaga horti]UYQ93286.1 outer membrane beta-barrel family protein [Chitinophaga horti]